MDPITLKIAAYAGAGTAIITLLTLLWRYVVSPSWRLVRIAGENSKAIYEFLPALLAISARWPSASGQQSLAAEIDEFVLLSQLNQARLFAHLDSAKTPTYECGPDGRLIYANNALCALFELDHVDMMGYGWLDGIEPIDRISTKRLWEESIKDGIPYATTYHVRSARTRKKCFCEAEAFPLKLPDRKIIAYFGTVIPIETED